MPNIKTIKIKVVMSRKEGVYARLAGVCYRNLFTLCSGISRELSSEDMPVSITHTSSNGFSLMLPEQKHSLMALELFSSSLRSSNFSAIGYDKTVEMLNILCSELAELMSWTAAKELNAPQDIDAETELEFNFPVTGKEDNAE